MTNITDIQEHKRKYATAEMVKETIRETLSTIEEMEPDTEHDVYFAVMKDSEGTWSMSIVVNDPELPELILILEEYREALKSIYYGE